MKKKKSFLEVFRENYPALKDFPEKELTGCYCVSEFFDRLPCSGSTSKTKCMNCWKSDRDAEFIPSTEGENHIEAFLKVHGTPADGKAVPAETDTKITEVPEMSENKIVPAEDCEKAVPFDYSALDNETTKSLKDCEAVIKKKTADYFTLLGEKFKEAQDLLASHSSGTFEQWYTSIGFKRQTVYNLIQRYEFLSSPTVGERADVFKGLPPTLSYAVSDPKAPAELVDKALKGEIKTNADFQKLKKELEHAQETVKTLKDDNERKSEINKALAEDIDEKRKELCKKEQELQAASDRNTTLEAKNSENNKKISALESQVKELESRPIDVAVVNSGKISDAVFEKLEREKQQAIVDAVMEERRDWQDKADRDADTIDKLTAELETARKNKGSKKIFMLTVDETQLEKIRGIIGNVKFMEV